MFEAILSATPNISHHNDKKKGAKMVPADSINHGNLSKTGTMLAVPRRRTVCLSLRGGVGARQVLSGGTTCLWLCCAQVVRIQLHAELQTSSLFWYRCCVHRTGNRDVEAQLPLLLLVPKMLSCHCADSEGHIFMGMMLPAQIEAETSGDVWKLIML